MARNRPAPRDFGTGELDPKIDGLSNEVTARGCRTLENFIVRKTGGAVRRPGTRFVAEVADSNDSTILVPVEIDEDNIYVLELGDAYIRFYNASTHAVVGAPYSVTSPWSTGELSSLRWQYVPEDQAIFWTHPLHAMRKLAFTSAASWALGFAGVSQGPLFLMGGAAIPLLSTSDDFENIDIKNFPIPSGVTADGAVMWIEWRAGLYAVLFIEGSDRYVFVSDDGTNWIDVTPGGLQTDALGESSTSGTRLTIGRDGSLIVYGNGSVFVSNDGGVGWNEITLSGPSTSSGSTIAYNDEDGSYRVTDGARQSARGFKGTSWNSLTALTSTDAAKIIEAGNGAWVMLADRGADTVAYYAGSVTEEWSVAQVFTGVQYTKLAYGEPHGSPLWIATGGSNQRISSNGQVWSLMAEQGIEDVSWVNPYFYLTTNEHLYRSEYGTTGTWNEVVTGLPTFQSRNLAPLIRVYDDDRSLVFRESGKYPRDVTAHESRLVIGGTNDAPSTVYGSESGNHTRFALGDLANEAWEYKLSGDRNVDIQWIMGGPELVVGTRTEEIVLRGEHGLGITPNAVQALKQSTFGSANVKPVRIHNTIVFVQRGGEVVRGYVPGVGTDAWQSPDLTYHAGHITDGGVTQLAHQDDPQTILYAIRGDGTLLAMTYHPPNVTAWSRIVTDGDFESIAVVPTSGAEDEIWAIVNRNVNGTTKRYIEYFDPLNVTSQTAAHYVDCGVSVTSGATFSTMGSLTHLAGEVVDVLIDGNEWLTGLTVAASGTIAFTSGYSGTTAHAGLPYTSKLQTMRGDWGSPWGSGAGLNKRVSDVLLWVSDSLGGFTGPTYTLATEAVIALSSTASLETDVKVNNFPGQFDRDSYIWVVVTQPVPFEVVAMAPTVETGDK